MEQRRRDAEDSFNGSADAFVEYFVLERQGVVVNAVQKRKAKDSRLNAFIDVLQLLVLLNLVSVARPVSRLRLHEKRCLVFKDALEICEEFARHSGVEHLFFEEGSLA